MSRAAESQKAAVPPRPFEERIVADGEPAEQTVQAAAELHGWDLIALRVPDLLPTMLSGAQLHVPYAIADAVSRFANVHTPPPGAIPLDRPTVSIAGEDGSAFGAKRYSAGSPISTLVLPPPSSPLVFINDPQGRVANTFYAYYVLANIETFLLRHRDNYLARGFNQPSLAHACVGLAAQIEHFRELVDAMCK